MPFQVRYRNRRVERDLQRLEESDRRRINAAIDALAPSPRPPGSVMLQGRQGAYRIRVGNYRVIYSIEYAIRVVWIDEIIRRNERTYRRR